MRAVCLLYAVALTLLLLTRDPASLVGIVGAWRLLLQSAHFWSFLVLTLLMMAARWPASRWSIVGLLAVYAALTEFSQYWTATRRPEWSDWVQNIAGIAAGLAIYWTLAAAFGRKRTQTPHKVRRPHVLDPARAPSDSPSDSPVCTR
ncbi:MAG: VanZ family protein [Planctomycetota bacterium]